MSWRCTSKAEITEETIELANDRLRLINEVLIADEGEVFQCHLDDSEHEIHMSYLYPLERNRVMFFCWTYRDDHQYVILGERCKKVDEREDEKCNLIKHHGGMCTWEYVDPQILALTADMEQQLAYLREHGTLPPKRGSGEV